MGANNKFVVLSKALIETLLWQNPVSGSKHGSHQGGQHLVLAKLYETKINKSTKKPYFKETPLWNGAFDIWGFNDGDRLWVKEEYRFCGESLVYRANSPAGRLCSDCKCEKMVWKTALSMPFDAARIFLTVKNFRLMPYGELPADSKCEAILTGAVIQPEGGFLALWSEIPGKYPKPNRSTYRPKTKAASVCHRG